MKKWRVNGDAHKVFYSLGDAFQSLFRNPKLRPSDDEIHKFERTAWAAGELRIGGRDGCDRDYYIDYGDFYL